MKVLLLGGGGREHALGWKLAESPSIDRLIVAPGNPGMKALGSTMTELDITDPASVTAVAREHGVDLVVVGPEAPLAAGVADALGNAGIRVFGPTKAAARLESSKAYANEVMARSGVSTAGAWAFTDADEVIPHLEAAPGPFVVKADGLAGGKGVLVTDDRAEAKRWAHDLLDGRFGDAGSTIVVEEFLSGTEVSVFAVCDGATVVPLEPARDYKRRFDGDEGPNTGGMGCYSPVADLPEDLVKWTVENVMGPVLETMADEGTPFTGFLYAGLMLTTAGPKVLEFNVRLGDPETQVVLPRLESDLFEVLFAAAAGDLTSNLELQWSDMAAVDVVLAAPAYPGRPATGQEITGLAAAAADDVLVFHAGTQERNGTLVTSGGRVLNVVGLGDDIESARAAAYGAAATIDFDGKQLRTDIAAAATTTNRDTGKGVMSR